MMNDRNELETLSYKFAIRIVNLYNYLKENKKSYGLGDQIFRSGTSIGANIAEAQYAQSPADFISKMSIALKETNETKYWINLMRDTAYIKQTEADSLLKDCIILIKLLTSTIKTAKRNHQ